MHGNNKENEGHLKKSFSADTFLSIEMHILNIDFLDAL